MRADNSQFIVDAARRRREDALARANEAVAAALRAGEPITISALASRARVSRSWLYAEPTLRKSLAKLAANAPTPRQNKRALTSTPHPASDASLRARLDAALGRARRLETENRQLRDQLAHALGQLRHDRVVGAHQRPVQQ
ncbi:MAG: DUF6262 family protein [Actinomycetota bacterium]|nr:DUF6262 family protein [Actinomycetota bacterium]